MHAVQLQQMPADNLHCHGNQERRCLQYSINPYKYKHITMSIIRAQARPQRLHRVRVSCQQRESHVSLTRRRLLGCTCGSCCILTSPEVLGSDNVRPRNGIRDKFFADAMNHMDMYEEAISPVKTALFSKLQDALDSSLGVEKDGKYSIADIGIGTGPNVKFYDPSKTLLQAVEPNTFMKSYLDENLKEQGFPMESVQYQVGFAENLPLESESQDAVVCTLLLCSVSDVKQSLFEFHRVLKPGGSLLLIEHVRADPDERLLLLGQTLLNPLQRALADGCNLNRDTLQSIKDSGVFSTHQVVERFTVPGLGLLSPHIAGILKKT